MTGPERSDLRLALDILRDWRREDAEWKLDTTRRIGVLEDRFVRIDALAEAEVVTRTKKLTRDQRIGVAVGIAGSIVGAVAYLHINGLL